MSDGDASEVVGDAIEVVGLLPFCDPVWCSEHNTVPKIEVTPEMARVGARALFPDGWLRESADEFEVMTRVFRAMIMGRDPREVTRDEFLALLGLEK